METMVIERLLCYKYYRAQQGTLSCSNGSPRLVGSGTDCSTGKRGRMAKRTKVQLGTETVDGVDLDFRTLHEEWNEYETEDGSRVRVKLVVTEIIRTDQYDTQADQPVYVVRSGNIVVTKAQDELKEKLRRRHSG